MMTESCTLKQKHRQSQQYWIAKEIFIEHLK